MQNQWKAMQEFIYVVLYLDDKVFREKLKREILYSEGQTSQSFFPKFSNHNKFSLARFTYNAKSQFSLTM